MFSRRRRRPRCAIRLKKNIWCYIGYKASSSAFATEAAGIVGILVHISALCSIPFNAVKGKPHASCRYGRPLLSKVPHIVIYSTRSLILLFGLRSVPSLRQVHQMTPWPQIILNTKKVKGFYQRYCTATNPFRLTGIRHITRLYTHPISNYRLFQDNCTKLGVGVGWGVGWLLVPDVHVSRKILCTPSLCQC